MKKELAVFEGHEIRRIYDESTETWWFSVVDIIQVLTQQPNYSVAQNYWKVLKHRLKKEGSQLVTNGHQLKRAAADGKQRLTDVATAYKVFRTPVVQGLGLRAIGFEFCAEVTAKLLLRRERIVEVPIGYHPRGTVEGKKLSYFRDGMKAAWWLLWLRCSRLPRQ